MQEKTSVTTEEKNDIKSVISEIKEASTGLKATEDMAASLQLMQDKINIHKNSIEALRDCDSMTVAEKLAKISEISRSMLDLTDELSKDFPNIKALSPPVIPMEE
jgi:hypothetical protein